MTIYIILYAMLLFSIVFENKKLRSIDKKKIVFFWIIVFTLFRGLRWETGTDWEQYYEVFQQAEWGNIFSFARGFMEMEWGYVFLNVLIKKMGGNYTTFLLLTNLFILYSYYRFSFSNSDTPIYVFVLILFSTQFFPVRMGIATGVIILGLTDFTKRKYLRIALSLFVAMSIHKSAIVFAPVYALIFFNRIPTFIALAASIGAFILVASGKIDNLLTTLSFGVNLIGGGELGDRYDHYLDYNEAEKSGMVSSVSSGLTSLIFIGTLIPFGYVVNYMKKYQDSKVNYAFMYNMYFVFVIIGIVFSSEHLTNLKRMQNYFMVAFPMLFSALILVGKRKYSGFIFTLVFGLYALFRLYTLFFGGFPEENFPYYSIFEKPVNR